ncbi:class I SAM-dependent methyltransferase [Novosphingobium beihaiensis]|uniref:Class I SAM-dependent methyltransferase n=1 Tax=Novosphingobium beihaiensis TaxID=2930389 RepID=A0ABT0BM82_9SPHN|nr:class I SAM-dependent methyltransferase [Novosphingobium beihaiensis]MCJ2185958.1 class I SAM-dependent methyltransferase [Novosphingobium beihaiensis]
MSSDAQQEHSDRGITEAFFPEAKIDGFSRYDGTLLFYSKVKSLLKKDDIVLDFGAGRGAGASHCRSNYIKSLQNFKGECAEIHGCDVDPVVKDNPYLDEARIQEVGGALPYEKDFFDLIVSSWVFEHIEDPRQVASELIRVLKPGGYICARTPNKFGYISFFSRLFRNKYHAYFLKFIQPERNIEDEFHTYYRMNSKKDIEKIFGDTCDVVVFSYSADPSYHFNSKIIYWIFTVIHKLTPSVFGAAIFIFLRKR